MPYRYYNLYYTLFRNTASCNSRRNIFSYEEDIFPILLLEKVIANIKQVRYLLLIYSKDVRNFF